MEWVEKYIADPNNKHEKQKRVIKRRTSMLKRLQSNISGSSMTAWGRMQSFFGDDMQSTSDSTAESYFSQSFSVGAAWHSLAIFSAGLSLGLLISSRK